MILFSVPWRNFHLQSIHYLIHFLGCETRSWPDEITLDNTADWPQHKINSESVQMSKVWKVRFDAFVDTDDSAGWQAIFHGMNPDDDPWMSQTSCGGRIAAVWINSDQQRIDKNIEVQEGQFRKALKIYYVSKP